MNHALMVSAVDGAGERIANVFQAALPMANIAGQPNGTAGSFHIRMYSRLVFVPIKKSCRNQNGGLVLLMRITATVRVTQIPVHHTVLITIIWSALERASDGRRPD